MEITASADIGTLRAHYENVGERLTAAGLSPKGARAVFEARGEILTVPVDKGDARNLTNTPGVMERDPAWSPDGRWIAYFSDESGEYALHIRDQKGEGAVRKIALPPYFYSSPTWSPDSRRISFVDKSVRLWLVDVDKGRPVAIDKNPISRRDDVMDAAWSPDSQWVAYARHLDNRLRAIFIHSVATGKTAQVTDGLSDARSPVFDRSGRYLYFSASTNLGPALSFAEMSTFPFLSSRSLYAVVLPADLPSPLAPQSDEETVGDEKGSDGGGGNSGNAESDTDSGGSDDEKEKKAEEKSKPVRIDFEGIGQRIIALPVPSRDYAALYAGKAGQLLVIEQPVAGPGDAEPGPPTFIVHSFDLETRKFDRLLAGARGFFAVSADGQKALFRQGPKWFIKPIRGLGGPAKGDGDDDAPSGALNTESLQVRVDPRVEWRQMFAEVWRGERDFFYDPGLHGLDLAKATATYLPYVDAVAHRSDLSYLFTEMLNQLTIGHMFIRGGDAPRAKLVPGGLLGCDFGIEGGRYRFVKIFNGENWNPDLRAPLTAPGVNVKQGEYLLAVGGRELRATDDVHAFFENTSDRQVTIRVGPRADGTGARNVVVVPVADEAALRNRDWVEGNRRKVDALSGGRLAYVYVPDTSNDGYASFNRYFFAQTNRVGAVIDERFNGGGALADYMVEYLSRPLLNYVYSRDGVDIPTPVGAIYGPKAMIINELAGSGGDALPWYFRKMKLGPLIGKRTWGGLVASARAPLLMDGGAVTAPNPAIYGLDGTWEVENVGIAPDEHFEVDLDPKAWRNGGDPQLERAVAWLLEELKRNPPPTHKRPPFPRYQ